MPNSLQSSAIASPASRRATNCSLSSITEHSFQGIIPSPLRGESVTYVSGTMCYLCLRPLKKKVLSFIFFAPRNRRVTLSASSVKNFYKLLCRILRPERAIYAECFRRRQLRRNAAKNRCGSGNHSFRGGKYLGGGWLSYNRGAYGNCCGQQAGTIRNLRGSGRGRNG